MNFWLHLEKGDDPRPYSRRGNINSFPNAANRRRPFTDEGKRAD
jgi:hypothetical protein